MQDRPEPPRRCGAIRAARVPPEERGESVPRYPLANLGLGDFIHILQTCTERHPLWGLGFFLLCSSPQGDTCACTHVCRLLAVLSVDMSKAGWGTTLGTKGVRFVMALGVEGLDSWRP